VSPSAGVPDRDGIDLTLAALADPVRRRCVELLAGQPFRAGELSEALGVSAPVMSRHLRVLRGADLVEEAHPPFDARVRIYSLRAASMGGLKAWIARGGGRLDPAARRVQGSPGEWVSGSRVLVALRVSAPPTRTFSVFTGEIDQWWQPNGLFRFTDGVGGHLAFEPDPPERLVEIGADGERFEIGPVTLWDPPNRLVFGWRQAGFPAGRSTEVSVRFDPVNDGTRVTIEHFGWARERLPDAHPIETL
jgi:DNA-binding transcriptional ArsR family regulator/uncharacterized protein YndB with AHSA1/START domain